MSDRMVVIRTFSNDFDANVSRAVLESCGIDSVVVRDDGGGWEPALMFAGRVRLAVRASDEEEARAALEAVARAGAEEEDESDLAG